MIPERFKRLIYGIFIALFGIWIRIVTFKRINQLERQEYIESGHSDIGGVE